MRSSYRDEDVTLLLKDITGMVQPQPTEEREKQIQAGKHYSEMLKKRDRTLCSSHWLAPVFQSEF